MTHRIFALIGLLALVSGAHGETYNLQLTGTILSRTCAVSAESSSLLVTFGNVNSTRFARQGDGSRYEPFTIKLEHCGAKASNVTVTFNGAPDSHNPALLTLTPEAGAATGVAIALYDSDKNLIPLGQSDSGTQLIPNQASVLINFYARYLANGDAVSSGSANASATFMLNYA
jgi:type 1 fimbria pilin